MKSARWVALVGLGALSGCADVLGLDIPERAPRGEGGATAGSSGTGGAGGSSAAGQGGAGQASAGQGGAGQAGAGQGGAGQGGAGQAGAGQAGAAQAGAGQAGAGQAGAGAGQAGAGQAGAGQAGAGQAGAGQAGAGQAGAGQAGAGQAGAGAGQAGAGQAGAGQAGAGQAGAGQAGAGQAGGGQAGAGQAGAGQAGAGQAGGGQAGAGQAGAGQAGAGQAGAGQAGASGATCSDGKRNGDETDLDCGGATCPKCLDGASCVQAADCANGVCDTGTCGPTPCTVATSPLASLVGWWHFDLVDELGSYFPAAVVPDPGFVDGLLRNPARSVGATSVVAGLQSGALMLSGGHAAIKDAPELRLTTEMTLDGWIQTTAGGIVAAKSSGAAGSGFSLSVEGGKLRFRVAEVDALCGDVPLGTWTHVAATYSAAAKRARIYVGGALACDVPAMGASINDFTGPLRFGTDESGSAPFDGLVDEMRLFSRELASSHVAAQSNGGTCQVVAPIRWRGAGYTGTCPAATQDAYFVAPGYTATMLRFGNCDTTDWFPSVFMDTNPNVANPRIQHLKFSLPAKLRVDRVTFFAGSNPIPNPGGVLLYDYELSAPGATSQAGTAFTKMGGDSFGYPVVPFWGPWKVALGALDAQPYVLRFRPDVAPVDATTQLWMPRLEVMGTVE